ncbi:hypothetical protein CK203_115098 [Vitis vinifera]|uniref:DUF4283 domain-containing protein n=1 Tax=Vitis vinifera TaxID=29760 RepID=A0A438C8Q5_VITVI|nr:hypothetical protein CK203_115098 [Vitis vinifera]
MSVVSLGDKCWFGVESKTFEILVDEAKGKVLGTVCERSPNFSSWIRFSSKGFSFLLEGAETCCFLKVGKRFKKVWMEEKKILVGVVLKQSRGVVGGWQLLAGKLRSLGFSLAQRDDELLATPSGGRSLNETSVGKKDLLPKTVISDSSEFRNAVWLETEKEVIDSNKESSWMLRGHLRLALLGGPFILFEFEDDVEVERVLHSGVKWFKGAASWGCRESGSGGKVEGEVESRAFLRVTEVRPGKVVGQVSSFDTLPSAKERKDAEVVAAPYLTGLAAASVWNGHHSGAGLLRRMGARPKVRPNWLWIGLVLQKGGDSSLPRRLILTRSPSPNLHTLVTNPSSSTGLLFSRWDLRKKLLWVSSARSPRLLPSEQALRKSLLFARLAQRPLCMTIPARLFQRLQRRPRSPLPTRSLRRSPQIPKRYASSVSFFWGEGPSFSSTLSRVPLSSSLGKGRGGPSLCLKIWGDSPEWEAGVPEVRADVIKGLSPWFCKMDQRWFSLRMPPLKRRNHRQRTLQFQRLQQIFGNAG